MSRVRRLSVRCRWAIVLGATALSFAVLQRASATPPAIQSRAAARSELGASPCRPTARWPSVDSDHVVALAEAWRSARQAMLKTCAP